MAIFSNQVNGHAVPGTEHLTSNIDYFTISTPVDIVNNVTATDSLTTNEDTLDASYGAPAGFGGSKSNLMGALDKLIEIVAQRGQPVIMGTPSGTGPYTFRFATEHKGSWNVTGTMLVDNSAVDLQAAILAAGKDFGFDANTTVTVSSSL
jgi:hypothetical protein